MTFHIGKATHLTFMHHRFNIRRSSYKAKNSKLHVVQIAVCIQKRVLCIVIYSFLKKIYEVLAERPILLEIIYIHEFLKSRRVCYRYCALSEVYASKTSFMMLVTPDE